MSMNMTLLTEAAYECMAPEQMNAFEALFADADLACRYANCVRKRLTPEATHEQQPAAWISYDTVMHKERIDRMPITSLQPGVYKHTPLYLHPSVEISRIRSILACEIECGIFEQHVQPALDAVSKALTDRMSG